MDTRSIDLTSLNALQDKVVYKTTNEKHVLAQDVERTIREPEFTLLGFLNGYSYSSASGYLAKETLKGQRISQILLDVEHGYFYEGLNVMYFTGGKYIYCVDESLHILWEKELNDYIRSISMDFYGNAYINFVNSRLILKYNKKGEQLLYLLDSEDVTKEQRIYKTFITPGSGFMYLIGSSFYDYEKVDTFIDVYDTRKAEIIERQFLYKEIKHVKEDDPYYEFYDIRVIGDYIYLYGKQYIMKVNLKLIKMWQYSLGYNPVSRIPNDLAYIEYDNSNYDEGIYFAEDLYDTKGHSIGKLTSTGHLVWQIQNTENSMIIDFQLSVYNGIIYTLNIQDINNTKSYILSINDGAFLLQVDNGNLVKISEYNDELIDPENYFGMRLIGRQIKDGIEKFLKVPLMHDTGPLLVDEHTLLYAKIKNDHYTDPENYIYFYLLASDRLAQKNMVSVLTTLQGQIITSYFGSGIMTKEPYTDTIEHEFISDDSSTRISTKDDKSLVRKGEYYSRTRYLLADRFKFRKYLVTKKTHTPIITKAFHNFIGIKSRYIYKYVMKRLTDIDVIVEFLEQNGILDTMIPFYVDRLRHHTAHMIKDIQLAGAPNLYDIMPVKKFEYKFDGYDYPIRKSNTQIYMLKNMPYNKKRDFKSIFIDSMANLVENKEIRPFILFVGGKAIKWSDMVIVRDWFYSYVIIRNIRERDYNVDSIIFPCTVRYGEDNQVLPNDHGHMYFDSNGLITENVEEIAFRIEVLDACVSAQDIIPNDNQVFQLSGIEKYQISDTNNIIVFEDGKLYDDSRFYIKPFGMHSYKWLKESRPYIKSFYYNKANDSKNLLITLPNQGEVSNDTNKIANDESGADQHYVDSFQRQFDFKLSSKKTYARNIAEATRYILTYNMQLLIDYYKDKANFKSYNYTGEQLYKLMPPEGAWVRIPRQRRNGLDDFIIVFHNDRLYHHYKEIEYENRYFKIPIFNHVKREDKIEILHFKNVDNTYYDITISKDKDDYITRTLRHDNFLLFANSPTGKKPYDEFSVENNEQYEVSFEYRNEWNGKKYIKTEISLDDPYYYEKPLKIVSKRQFAWMYYHVQSNTNVFRLNPQFRFCRNKNQYLVFVDGIKLNSDDFSLQFMTSEHQIDCMTIETRDEISKGSYIYFIYVPDAYDELIVNNYSSQVSNGDITLDTSELEYPFDKDLFMISIDGEKILNSNIQNISSHRVRIIHKEQPFNEICINRFMQPDALLKEVFSYGDSWSRAVDTLSPKDYVKLFKDIKK